MAGVTLELMFGVLKSLQARLAQVDGKIDELKQEIQASRTSQNGFARKSPVYSRRFRAFTQRWSDMKGVWIVSSAGWN